MLTIVNARTHYLLTVIIAQNLQLFPVDTITLDTDLLVPRILALSTKNLAPRPLSHLLYRWEKLLAPFDTTWAALDHW